MGCVAGVCVGRDAEASGYQSYHRCRQRCHTGTLLRHCTNAQVRRHTGTPVHRGTDTLIHWYTSTLISAWALSLRRADFDSNIHYTPLPLSPPHWPFWRSNFTSCRANLNIDVVKKTHVCACIRVLAVLPAHVAPAGLLLRSPSRTDKNSKKHRQLRMYARFFRML